MVRLIGRARETQLTRGSARSYAEAHVPPPCITPDRTHAAAPSRRAAGREPRQGDHANGTDTHQVLCRACVHRLSCRSVPGLCKSVTRAMEGRAALKREGEHPMRRRLHTRWHDVHRGARQRDALADLGTVADDHGGAQRHGAAKAERAGGECRHAKHRMRVGAAPLKWGRRHSGCVVNSGAAAPALSEGARSISRRRRLTSLHRGISRSTHSVVRPATSSVAFAHLRQPPSSHRPEERRPCHQDHRGEPTIAPRPSRG